MPIQKPRTLSGFMELLPQKQVLFDAMVEKLRRPIPFTAFPPWTPLSSRPARSCSPKAAARRKNKYTALPRGTVICPFVLT